MRRARGRKTPRLEGLRQPDSEPGQLSLPLENQCELCTEGTVEVKGVLTEYGYRDVCVRCVRRYGVRTASQKRR